MPFELRNLAQTFQRLFAEVKRSLPAVFTYLADVLIASPTSEDDEPHLHILFHRLQKYALVVNASQCVFGASELECLGHHISSEGVHPHPSYVKVIQVYAQPTTLSQLRPFLSVVDFSRRFIAHYGKLLHRLTELLRSPASPSSDIFWSSEAQASFTPPKRGLPNVRFLSILVATPQRG
ncbi:uncharacterized protein LOC142588599 [Dermacentor variabilis]|uniref:uncharacterized protein LOC142588599 n=1 Tax=Dermacentor variabilis TaxID=34621 RepID=UPI003F5B09A9